jgi:hypothetical protein
MTALQLSSINRDKPWAGDANASVETRSNFRKAASDIDKLYEGLDIQNRVTLFDDFLGDVLASNWNAPTKGTDGQTVSPAITAGVGGLVTMVTGDDAAASMAVNGVSLTSELNWKANQGNLVFEARVKVSAITGVTLFVGLTDDKSTLECPVTVGASDALTTNAADAVGFVFDTNADTDKIWLVGVANNVDATAQNSGLVYVADTYRILRIELSEAGVASFYIDNTLIGSAMTGAVTASVALTPVVAAYSGAASRTVTVDYILVAADR